MAVLGDRADKWAMRTLVGIGVLWAAFIAGGEVIQEAEAWHDAWEAFRRWTGWEASR